MEAIGTERCASWLDRRELRRRLLIVLGTSHALGELVARHPEFIADLAPTCCPRCPRPWRRCASQMGRATDGDSLRVAYYRKLLQVAARDLTAHTSFEQSSAELADLAVATLGAALKIARAAEDDPDACRLPSWRWARPAAAS